MQTIYISVQPETIIRLLALGLVSGLLSVVAVKIVQSLRKDVLQPKRAARQQEVITQDSESAVLLGVIAFVTVVAYWSTTQTALPIAIIVGGVIVSAAAMWLKNMSKLSPTVCFGLASFAGIAGLRFLLPSEVRQFPINLEVPLSSFALSQPILVVILCIVIALAARFVVANAEQLPRLNPLLLGASFFALGGIGFLEGMLGLAGMSFVIAGACGAYAWLDTAQIRIALGRYAHYTLAALLTVIALRLNVLWFVPFCLSGYVFFWAIGAPGRRSHKETMVRRFTTRLGWAIDALSTRLVIVHVIGVVTGLLIYLANGEF